MNSILLRGIGAVVLVVGIFASGWAVNGWRKDAEIHRMKAEWAKADLSDATTALADLKAVSQTVRAKADEFNVTQNKLGAKLDAIQKDMKNAKPLPADCRPDDFRVRRLSDAVEAAKQAAAAR